MNTKYTKVTKASLMNSCRELGLTAGDMVMVHASLRSVGNIVGGPDVLIDAILDAIAPGGTILLYIGCQSPFDDIGHGVLDPEDEAFVLEQCPSFDPNTSRAAREFGSLAELFRTRGGVRCSQNPSSRMAAQGAKATWLTEDHPLNYGLGRNSPLERLCSAGGKVLLIGSDPDHVTLLHYAEAIAPISCKKTVRLQFPLSVGVKRQWTEIEEYDNLVGIKPWPKRFFASITEEFLKTGAARTGILGNATSYLVDARALVDFAVPVMVTEAATMDGNVPAMVTQNPPIWILPPTGHDPSRQAVAAQ